MVNSYDGVNYVSYTSTDTTGGVVTSFTPGVKCNNTVDGNTTTATDVNGNIVKGCGNVISNNNATVVMVAGFKNIVSNNEVRSTDSSERMLVIGTTDDPVNSSVITGNAAGAYFICCVPVQQSRTDLRSWHQTTSRLKMPTR